MICTNILNLSRHICSLIGQYPWALKVTWRNTKKEARSHGGHWEMNTSITNDQNKQEIIPGCGNALPLTSNLSTFWDYMPVLKHSISQLPVPITFIINLMSSSLIIHKLQFPSNNISKKPKVPPSQKEN